MINLPGIKYLVVGTGHCGTTWATEVLRCCGVNAVHEGIFQDSIQDVSEWMGKWEAEVSCKAAPYVSEIPDGIQVLHLVRRPIDVIRSMYYTPAERGWAHASRDWVEGELGMLLPRDPLEFIVAFYCEWTDMIDKQGIDRIYRVEDGAVGLASALGLKLERPAPLPLGERKAKGSPEMDYGDIPDGPYKTRLMRKARQYGYEKKNSHQHGQVILCGKTPRCLSCGCERWDIDDDHYKDLLKWGDDRSTEEGM